MYNLIWFIIWLEWKILFNLLYFYKNYRFYKFIFVYKIWIWIRCYIYWFWGVGDILFNLIFVLIMDMNKKIYILDFKKWMRFYM